MKARVTCLSALLSILFAAFAFSADVTPWKLSLTSNLTVGLNMYSDNWVGGEVGSFAWVAQMLGEADKQLTPVLLTKNTLQLAFGQTNTQNKDTKNWSKPQKSTDLIDFGSVWSFTLGWFVDPFASVRVISEFLDGSDTLYPHYGNPVTITEALGATRILIKNQSLDWNARLGAAARQLVDRYKLTNPGVSLASESHVTNDGGVEFVTGLKAANQAKWAFYTTDLTVFEALVSSNAKDLKGTPQADDWRYPNVNWQNMLTLNVSKYIVVNAYVQMLYDRLISKNLRLKETLGVGLTYTFASK